MKHELDKMMGLIKDYKTGYGGVTDSFMRKELEMFAKDYHSEQCNIADVSERLYTMQLHEEWIVGVSQGNQAQLTICRVPSGWIYNYRTGNGQLTSTFVPFDNRFQNAR